jgi:hypothetical protein
VVSEFYWRIFERHLVGDPLLQQQVRGLDAWLVLEPALHREVVKRVIERHQDHALVVGH